MGHTYSQMLIHVVFSTKDRAPLIETEHEQRLYEYMAGIAKNEFGKAIKIGGVADHVHVLMSLKTKVSISHAVNRLKSLSSGWMKQTFGLNDFAWQNGYAAFSVSHSMRDQVERYIAQQKEHHRKVSFQEEYRLFLERHGVEFDPAMLA